jgi:methylase of polypeptide subunit release factors
MTLFLSLEENIKCGNSLVGMDFYAQPNLNLTDDNRIKVNCFDWEKEFTAIFKTGGFDVIIGNPPYFNIQILGAKSETAQYIQKKYADIWQDKSDILFYFPSKALRLSKSNVPFLSALPLSVFLLAFRWFCIETGKSLKFSTSSKYSKKSGLSPKNSAQ